MCSWTAQPSFLGYSRFLSVVEDFYVELHASVHRCTLLEILCSCTSSLTHFFYKDVESAFILVDCCWIAMLFSSTKSLVMLPARNKKYGL